MKYINLSNDFEVDRTTEEGMKAMPDEELTAIWLRAGMTAGFSSGLPSDKRRIYSSICEKLGKAVDAKAKFVEVSPVEFSVMKEGFEKGVTKPEQVRYVTIAENALLAATDVLPTSTTVNGQPSAPMAQESK